MMTIGEFEEAMDQIAEELPEEFYRESERRDPDFAGEAEEPLCEGR